MKKRITDSDFFSTVVSTGINESHVYIYNTMTYRSNNKVLTFRVLTIEHCNDMEPNVPLIIKTGTFLDD